MLEAGGTPDDPLDILLDELSKDLGTVMENHRFDDNSEIRAAMALLVRRAQIDSELVANLARIDEAKALGNDTKAELLWYVDIAKRTEYERLKTELSIARMQLPGVDRFVGDIMDWERKVSDLIDEVDAVSLDPNVTVHDQQFASDQILVLYDEAFGECMQF